MIHVVNIKTYRPSDYPKAVYIGRSMPGRQGSPLGNPFRLRDWRCDAERAEVLGKYEAWLRERLKADTAQRREIERLVYLARDESLALLCWCAPEICHGDVVKKIVEERLRAGERRKGRGGMKKQESAAEIAKRNGWTSGNVLRARELQREDRFFQVTAVGYELVLGRRILTGNKRGNEIELPLTDEFIKWERI